ncbi:MAG: NAD(+) synthase [Bacteroidales bacterium]|nr:NAD(+) synthase [Bacteroidales bacterium]
MTLSFYLETIEFSFENFKNYVDLVSYDTVAILPFYYTLKNSLSNLYLKKCNYIENSINNILNCISHIEYIATAPYFDSLNNNYKCRILTNLKEVKRTSEYVIAENYSGKFLISLSDTIQKINISDISKEFHISVIVIFNHKPFDITNSKLSSFFAKNISNNCKLVSILVNPLGIHKTQIFDGNVEIYENGNIIGKSFLNPSFSFYKQKEINIDNISDISIIHDILVYGIKEYFKLNGLKRAIIGISGGIDSAVATSLTVKALGNENILGIIMPSQFTPNQSIIDAIDFCKKIGIKYHIVPITTIYKKFLDELSIYFKDENFDTSEENLQARIRMIILMWFSNKFGYTVINTSNKSEIATGYGTIYGDISGALSVIGDLYKTQVYELANYINSKMKVIPSNIINKEPSAELKENQKDSDSLPPYDILDKILHEVIENEKSKEEILKEDFDEVTIEKTLLLMQNNAFKLLYLPPILKISTKTFNIDILP